MRWLKKVRCEVRTEVGYWFAYLAVEDDLALDVIEGGGHAEI